MATNPAVERAKLFAFLQAENPTTLPVFNETTGELQLVAQGPNPMDRTVVHLKPKASAELLNSAPIEHWQTPASTNGLIDAINNSWLSVPDPNNLPQQPVVPTAPAEDTHFLVKWCSTATPQLSEAGKARMHFDGSVLLLSENGGPYNAVVPPVSALTLTYAASVELDFDPALPKAQSLGLAGDVTFTTANLGAGREVTLRIVADGSLRNFTFPGTWKFVSGTVPASIAATKTALLRLTSYGNTDTDVVADYSVEP